MKAKYLLFMLFIIACTLNLKANNDNWEFNPYAFQYDMSVYLTLSSVDNKSITDISNYQIAAFCNDECRGIAEERVIGEHKYLYLRVRSNSTEGDIINFKVKNRTTEKILKVTETLEFKSQQIIGFPSTPFVLNARNIYSVTFIIDGVEHRSDLYFGDIITIPTITNKEGYSFIDWNPYVDATVPDHDVTYTAIYSINQYKVTFVAEGVIVFEDLLNYGSQIIIPDAPDKEGYSFSTWGEVEETVPNHDVTYTAVYEINKYLLEYYVDGELYYNDSVAYGAALPIPKEPELYDGTFSGWDYIPSAMPAHDVMIEGCFEFVYDNINYKIINVWDTYRSVKVVPLKEGKYTGHIKIPNSVTYKDNVYIVEGIGDIAFYQCEDLQSIQMPDYIEYIGGEAFSGCSSLKEIHIPNKVSSVPYSAFENCTSLNHVILPDKLEYIQGFAFSGCSSLTEIVLPTTLKSINSFSFSDCISLGKVLLSDSLQEISSMAFAGCKSLQSIDFPKNLTAIGQGAFMGCESIDRIEIPTSIVTIGVGAFAMCPNIESITVASNNTVYDSRNNCNAIIKSDSDVLIAGCLNTHIPDGITAIDVGAFMGCKQLSSLVIPNSINSIGEYAFEYCSGLSYIISENTIPPLAINAFHELDSVIPVYVPVDCVEKYSKAEGWNQFQNIVANAFIISSSPENGVVDGLGTYKYGTIIELYAIPNEGYRFVKWSDEITENPRQIIVTENFELLPLFEVDETGVEVFNQDSVSIRTVDNRIYVEGTDNYKVYDLNGRMIDSCYNLEPGIYFIVVDSKVYKITL